MLRKLFKHEWKETAKLLIPLNLLLLGITLIGAILLKTPVFTDNTMEVIAVSFTAIYIISLIALFVVTVIYLTIRFYKTMYSDQGYLTHTLPVSTGSILNTKILVSAFWNFIALCITACSVFLLIRVLAGDEWSLTMADIVNASPEIFGMEFPQAAAYLIFCVVLSCFAMMLTIFASLSVGQLFQQHRILASIVSYAVFYMIQQIISVIYLFILGMKNREFFIQMNESTVSGTISQGLFSFSIWETVLFLIVSFVLCHYITRKRLNLE